MTKEQSTRRKAPAAPRARKRMTREELTPLAREAIFRAAAQVVGEVGYAQASVARITSVAGIAQGTFYLYFPTRQSLFDELLTHARREMLALVREQVAGARDFFELEERGMTAFLQFVQRTPGFVRILNEAEAAAPDAYRRHYDDVAARFRRELQDASQAGQVRRLPEAEIDTAVHLLMGARLSLYEMLHREKLQSGAAARAAVAHYMTMVRNWLAPVEPAARHGRSRTAEKSAAIP